MFPTHFSTREGECMELEVTIALRDLIIAG